MNSLSSHRPLFIPALIPHIVGLYDHALVAVMALTFGRVSRYEPKVKDY